MLDEVADLLGAALPGFEGLCSVTDGNGACTAYRRDERTWRVLYRWS